MKILFLHTLYPPHIGGGAEIMVRHTVEGLRRRGCAVAVLATGPEPGLHQETVDGVRVYRAGLRNFYWHFNQTRPSRLARFGWHCRDRYNRGMRHYVREVIARERPDIVLCNNLTGWSISAWDAITEAGLPIVQVIHDLYLLCPRDTMFSQGRRCERQCTLCAVFRSRHAAASAQVDAVIGVSRFALEKVVGQGYFAAASAHVVHNRLPAAGADTPAPARARHPLRFGYLGTLSENKGVAWLIEQFQGLSIDATLSIAGRGKLDYEQQLKALADPQKTRFVGYQESGSFLRSIDVLVVPSIWAEPFGLVAVEACAQHRPVIATAVGGLPEIIRDNLNGLLCNPDEPASLGQAMLSLYHDTELRQYLASQARASVMPLLDMERMLDDYQAILHKTLQGRSTSHESKPEPVHYRTARTEAAGD